MMLRNKQDIIDFFPEGDIIDVWDILGEERYINPKVASIIAALEHSLEDLVYCKSCEKISERIVCSGCREPCCERCPCENCNQEFILQCQTCEEVFTKTFLPEIKLCLYCEKVCCDTCYTRRIPSLPAIVCLCERCYKYEICKTCECFENECKKTRKLGLHVCYKDTCDKCHADVCAKSLEHFEKRGVLICKECIEEFLN